MSKRMRTLQRVLGTGLAWGGLWLVAAMTIRGVIGIVDPSTIDPGDTQGLVTVMGSMGFLSGVVFGILLSLFERGTTLLALSSARAAWWGLLATAVVQLGYLGHGDAGLAANIQMALAFCGFGGVIAVAWLLIAQRWSHWHSALRALPVSGGRHP